MANRHPKPIWKLPPEITIETVTHAITRHADATTPQYPPGTPLVRFIGKHPERFPRFYDVPAEVFIQHLAQQENLTRDEAELAGALLRGWESTYAELIQAARLL